jgi:hypothetical protein
LKWTFSSVAMQLVLRADEARRERLRHVGESLLVDLREALTSGLALRGG